MSKQLPPQPNLEYLKKQAKALLKSHQQSQLEVIPRIKEHHPRLSSFADSGILNEEFSLQDAQLVLAREFGFESWPKLVDAVASSTNNTFNEHVSAQAMTTQSHRDMPELVSTLFREMVDLGVLLPDSGICHLVLIDEENGWYRPHAARLHPKKWEISCSASHLAEIGDTLVVMRMTRGFNRDEEDLPDWMEDWREGQPWWLQQFEKEESVEALLLNDYKADKVVPEFLRSYSGDRWAVFVPFAQGFIRWADSRFSEEYVDIVKRLAEDLSQGLPKLVELR
jgi:hypothetical protein